MRVVKKTPVITTRSSKFFAMSLIDKWKGEIKASAFNGDCDHFDSIFTVISIDPPLRDIIKVNLLKHFAGGRSLFRFRRRSATNKPRMEQLRK